MAEDAESQGLHSTLLGSVTQFRLKRQAITNYVIQHLDYIIHNFCFFKDMALVAEYLCTDNSRFNFAFYHRMKTFMQIVGFRDRDVQDMVGALGISNTLSEEDLVMESRKRLFPEWDGSERCACDEDADVLVLNPAARVQRHFFAVLAFHFRIHPHYMIEAVDDDFVSAFLGLLNTEPALELFDVLLGFKGLNMQKLAMVLRDAHPISVLIGRRSYKALKMLLMVEWVGEDSESVSSDEDLFLDEIVSAGETLVSAFLTEDSYLEYKQIYDVIEILNCSHRRPRLPLVEPREADARTVLYIKLVVGQLDNLMDEIFEKGIHKRFLDLFFGHPDHSVLLFPLTVFFSAAIRDSSALPALVAAGLTDMFHDACIRCLSVEKGTRPATPSIFSCLVYLHPLLTFYLRKSNNEAAFSDRWIRVSAMMEPYDRMETLRYSNDEMVEGFLDDCVDEGFARYICQLIIDEMPVPSVFLNR